MTHTQTRIIKPQPSTRTNRTHKQTGELQACVDAAAERIAALEEELTKTQAEHEAAMVAKEQEHAGGVMAAKEQHTHAHTHTYTHTCTHTCRGGQGAWGTVGGSST